MYKRTKIVCTIGPACETKDMLVKMIEAGMNVARLNFSHGSYDNHRMLIENIRAASAETGQPVAIMQDLQGPKIRVGKMPEEGIELEEGKSIIFDTAKDVYEEHIIPVDWELLHQFLKPGERLLLNDGRMECAVEKVDGTQIHASVKVGGTLTSHKGMNVPDSTLEVRAMTEKDKQDAAFGVAEGVDLIALSFVMSPDDVQELRDLINAEQEKLEKKPAQQIGIITKIERAEAVERIDEILDIADGMMVARGDLGVEMPAQQVPVIQKRLIAKALEAAKPVIVATQMLDSMQDNPRPTRAEVSDVANAVIDHTDAVMLSNESAVGKYPIETVETMASIVKETENSAFDNMPLREPTKDAEPDDALSGLSRILAEEVGAKAIVAASISGETARLISRYRPEIPVLIVTPRERTKRQLNLSWGVLPLFVETLENSDDMVEAARETLEAEEIAGPGDRIILLSGSPLGAPGHEAELEVYTL